MNNISLEKTNSPPTLIEVVVYPHPGQFSILKMLLYKALYGEISPHLDTD